MKSREVWIVEILIGRNQRWEPIWGEFYASRQATIRAMRKAGVAKDNSYYRPALYAAIAPPTTTLTTVG